STDDLPRNEQNRTNPITCASIVCFCRNARGNPSNEQLIARPCRSKLWLALAAMEQVKSLVKRRLPCRRTKRQLRNPGWRGTRRRWIFDVRRFLHLIPLIAGMKTRYHHLLLWEAGVSTTADRVVSSSRVRCQ